MSPRIDYLILYIYTKYKIGFDEIIKNLNKSPVTNKLNDASMSGECGL